MEKNSKLIKKAQKCDNLSDYVDIFFTERIGILFSRIFIKLKFHPNTVTILSMIFGLVGGLCFIQNNLFHNILGVSLVIISAIFDVCDGQVARLTNKKSEFGRVLDGFADAIVYCAIYVGISIVIMRQNIPFTDIKWGWYIWPIMFVIGIILHSGQANIADYLRNIHMCFIKNEKCHEFSKSSLIAEELKEMKKPSINRFFKKFYLVYTKNQERQMPKLKELCNKVGKSSDGISKEASEFFNKKSSKIIRLTNVLTFNYRTYPLFVLIFLNLHFYIFPFVLFVLEPLKLFLKFSYEKIFKEMMNIFYSNNGNVNEI